MEKKKVSKEFYEAVRTTLFAGRVAGYLPITGLLQKDSHISRSNFFSLYSWYYLFSLINLIGSTLIHIYDIIPNERLRFKDFGGLLVQLPATVAALYLVRLCRNWKYILLKIEGYERLLPVFVDSKRVFRNINQVMVGFLLFGIIEHVTHLTFSVRMMALCHKDKEGFSFKQYYLQYNDWFFHYVPFNFITAVMIQIAKLQTTFVYFYIDALVVVVALYLIYRFRNFNRIMILRLKECKQNSRKQWTDIQAHYTRLSRLVKFLDDQFNPFVLMSIMCNLIFICKNIYDIILNIKRKTQYGNQTDCIIANSTDWIAVMFPVVSMVHLLLKTLFVSGASAHLHTLSRKPLDLLHTLPSSHYNLEIQRFIDQVYHSKVNLTGLQFFSVTKGTILSMLSTIITYELVLLQLPDVYS